MKRVGCLTERIADLDNLYLAFCKACRGKHCKHEVQKFVASFDENIEEIRKEIISGNLQVGRYHYFTIHDPKERMICAAPFNERVLHHAIMNVCHMYFDQSLIDDTYATRIGKGVYAAIDKVVKAAGCHCYLVKLDFRKYYDSINHTVLKQKLQRKFKDKTLIKMFYQIIDSYHADTDMGLPIGNLTSQYFANLYLSDLDHRAKEILKAPVYVRYMDDILIAADSKLMLKKIVNDLGDYAKSVLKLILKPPVYRTSNQGIFFLGYKVLPYNYQLSGRSKRRFRSKLILYDKRLSKGQWTERDYEAHILPLLAYVQYADSYLFRQACLKLINK